MFSLEFINNIFNPESGNKTKDFNLIVSNSFVDISPFAERDHSLEKLFRILHIKYQTDTGNNLQ